VAHRELARPRSREVTGDRAPLCVVLDEPTAALDPIAGQEPFAHSVDQARGATARGAVTVLVSHARRAGPAPRPGRLRLKFSPGAML